MNEAADAADVSNFRPTVRQENSDEQVTWEERLDYTPTPRRVARSNLRRG